EGTGRRALWGPAPPRRLRPSAGPPFAVRPKRGRSRGGLRTPRAPAGFPAGSRTRGRGTFRSSCVAFQLHVFQQGPERLVREEQPRLHRSDRKLQDLGDLFVGETLEIPEADHRPELRGELLERPV